MHSSSFSLYLIASNPLLNLRLASLEDFVIKGLWIDIAFEVHYNLHREKF